MSATAGDAQVLCSHCLLPLGLRPMRRAIDGAEQAFCCYGCCLAYQVRRGSREESEATWLLIRVGVGGFLSMNVMLGSLLVYSDAFDKADAHLLPWVNLAMLVLTTPALLLLGGPFMGEAWRDALRGRANAALLITLGVTAAYGASILAMATGRGHVYFDTACMLLVLFTIGRYLEAAGRARAARSLAPLLEAESQWATVVEAGAEARRPAQDLPAGTAVRVRPGERFPVDGLVLEGESHADEAVLTGESRPRPKGPGAAVLAGSINLEGVLLVGVTQAGAATRWAGICRAVRESLARKSPLHRLVDQVAGAFVPVVIVLAAATALASGHGVASKEALLAGLAVLVVACPCGLGLAAGLAGSLGIARLAERGCLVRGGAVLETLARVRLVAFDKTGTLTLGQPRLVGIAVDGVGEDEALARAAGLEAQSEHALARGIVGAAAARGLVPTPTAQVRAVAGSGIEGLSGGEPVAAGTGAWMRRLGWSVPLRLSDRAHGLEAGGHSVVHLGWGRVRALLWLDDTPRPEARAAVAGLARLGLGTTLLTGDLPAAAQRTAEAVGIARWQASLSPEDKRTAIAALQRTHGSVAMVGDGLNDGPVLAAADVGIAVGTATDLARETADLVLPPDGLRRLPWAIEVARATRRTILTSLAWAFGYNIVALVLAALGHLQPVLAAVMMASSSLIVVLNSLRLERLAERAPAEPAVPAVEPATPLGVKALS